MQPLEKQLSKFSSLKLAKSFVGRCEKINLIVMGDDGKFWVALPKVTDQLIKLGYEYAN
jgi:hypothetical protein